MPTYPVYTIANYFLLKAERQGQELLSNMKLQKLLYYAQGLRLAMGEGPLFNDAIEAWTYGPVVVSIYHNYKSHGNSGISPDDDFDPTAIDEDTREYLDEVLDVFGQFSAIRLMELSHQDKCWANTDRGDIIPNDCMENDLKKYLVDD